MKKMIWLAVALAFLGLLTACDIQANAAGQNSSQGDILVLADEGTLARSAAQRSLWNGVSRYCDEQGYTMVQALSAEATDEQRLQTLEDSLSKTARVVVSFGSDFETVFYQAQKRYPEVCFLLVDGEPRHADDEVYETQMNTHCLLFDETQAGFLAGYAAVSEGKQQLGFCGDRSSPDVIRYGYGLIQGANAAAERLQLKSGAISMRYWYAGENAQPDAIYKSLLSWYSSGTQALFVCDQGNAALMESAIQAAQESGGSLIGSDADRSLESDRVLFSTVKDYDRQVYAALLSLHDNGGRWTADRAGRTLCLGVKEEALSLAAVPGRMQQFSPDAQSKLLKELSSGAFPLDNTAKRDFFPAAPYCSVIFYEEL